MKERITEGHLGSRGRCVPRGDECPVVAHLLDSLETIGVVVRVDDGAIKLSGTAGLTPEGNGVVGALEEHHRAHPDEVSLVLGRRMLLRHFAEQARG